MMLKVEILIGRDGEMQQIQTCLRAERNLLIEGPVGVGKTYLVLQALKQLDRGFYRIDGDQRYSEQKLTGWFDPPMVMSKGFSKKAFVPGPLVEALTEGKVLFINELNRLPEGVQNILLPALDERMVLIPKLGKVEAKKGFQIIATQNPKEFVATSHLSEAILDRFEWIHLDYQNEEDEVKIVHSKLGKFEKKAEWVQDAVNLVRKTRSHPRVRRGASVRAALSIAELGSHLMNKSTSYEGTFLEAALISLPTRIEMERDSQSEKPYHVEIADLIRDLVLEVRSVKKKSP